MASSRAGGGGAADSGTAPSGSSNVAASAGERERERERGAPTAPHQAGPQAGGARVKSFAFTKIPERHEDHEVCPLLSESVAIVKMSPRKGDEEDVTQPTPREVKNIKYWVTKIGTVFRRVRQVEKRRKGSFGSGFSSLAECDIDEMTGDTVHYKPEAIDTLCELTKFNKRELQLMYRGFKQECPSGMVREDTFKGIYAQFFPRGADTSQYAHFVFNTFDQDHTGGITFTDFVIGMSVLARGSLQEKLRWAFNLYDINGDGFITKDEMTRIVMAIYDIVGRTCEPIVEENTTRDHVERVFQKLDLNKDGVVTIDEFLDSCSRDENIKHSMTVFNTEL